MSALLTTEHPRSQRITIIVGPNAVLDRDQETGK